MTLYNFMVGGILAVMALVTLGWAMDKKSQWDRRHQKNYLHSREIRLCPICKLTQFVDNGDHLVDNAYTRECQDGLL